MKINFIDIFAKRRKMLELKVTNQIINYTKINEEDYISIIDMLKSKDGELFVSDWLRNRNTTLIFRNLGITS